MESTSAQVRAEKQKKKEPFNLVKQKFLNKHEKNSDSDLLKEQLFEQQNQTVTLTQINTNLNIIKWLILICIIASVLIGLFIGFLD